MSEHEMCCGTTCDKQAVAEEFERLQERNRTLESLLKLAINERDNALSYGSMVRRELETVKNERDEALAYAERLQVIPYTKTRAEFMESWGVCGMSADKKRLANAAWDRAEWFFNQQAELLKAEWQAEAFNSAAAICDTDGFMLDASVYGFHQLNALRHTADKIRQRAQEAGDGSI